MKPEDVVFMCLGSAFGLLVLMAAICLGRLAFTSWEGTLICPPQTLTKNK